MASKQKRLSEDQAQLIAKALADPRRYQILKYLGHQGQASAACGSVLECVEITPPTLSHHMKELETAGLVEATRKGKYVSYLLRREVLEAFCERLKSDLI
jgi:ArsR family transcriptional regulator, arsenate/arsenite/antimonite-responsive transcriptional repressor